VAASLAWWLIFEIDIGPNVDVNYVKQKVNKKHLHKTAAFSKRRII
jgi:hypothetical protein